MGISADLIMFGEDGSYQLDDLNDQNLYEFFPPELHHLISKTNQEIYDLDYYKELYNCPDLYICTVDPTGIELSRERQTENITDAELDEWYKNIIHISQPKVTMAECNVINYEVLHYIGGSHAFILDIFKLYHDREHHPYLWKISDNITIDKRPTFVKYKNDPFVYIHLNY